MGVNSDLLRGAVDVQAGLLGQWNRHVKVCGTCIVKTAVRPRYCETGWKLVKAIRAAARVVEDLSPPPPPENGTLF